MSHTAPSRQPYRSILFDMCPLPASLPDFSLFLSRDKSARKGRMVLALLASILPVARASCSLLIARASRLPLPGRSKRLRQCPYQVSDQKRIKGVLIGGFDS